MRIISQDGASDVPYEHYSVCATRDEYDNIYHIICNNNGKTYRILAEYSTKAKATKAMEMLKAHYGLLSFMKFTAGTTKYESFIAKFTKDDFIKATTEYFQFPQDDEIEV